MFDRNKLLLFRAELKVPRVSAIKRDECNSPSPSPEIWPWFWYVIWFWWWWWCWWFIIISGRREAIWLSSTYYKTVCHVLQTKNFSRKCICLILENMICRSFKFNVSFSIIQSTSFIADTGGTLSQCPHYRTPVMAEDWFSQTSVIYFCLGFSCCPY